MRTDRADFLTNFDGVYATGNSLGPQSVVVIGRGYALSARQPNPPSRSLERLPRPPPALGKPHPPRILPVTLPDLGLVPTSNAKGTDMTDTMISTDWPRVKGVVAWPLEKNEKVLWQGRPSTAPHIAMRQFLKLGSGVFGLCLFLYLAERLQMQVAPYWDVWLIVLTVFFASIPADIARAMLVRRWTHYALTDRRALIATAYPLYGERIQSIPILRDTRIDHLRGRRSSVLFPLKSRFCGGAKAGFEQIEGGDEVCRLIGRILRGAV